MEMMDKLMEISSRLDHLENSAEWIARETVHSDQGISQTASLICVLTEELREKLGSLVKEIERGASEGKLH